MVKIGQFFVKFELNPTRKNIFKKYDPGTVITSILSKYCHALVLLGRWKLELSNYKSQFQKVLHRGRSSKFVSIFYTITKLLWTSNFDDLPLCSSSSYLVTHLKAPICICLGLEGQDRSSSLRVSPEKRHLYSGVPNKRACSHLLILVIFYPARPFLLHTNKKVPCSFIRACSLIRKLRVHKFQLNRTTKFPQIDELWANSLQYRC